MSNTTMTAEAKNAYNAYMREWRQKNPTKNAEYKTVHDTETIKIDVVKGVIIVEDKTAGITYTIERKAAKYGK